jgi:hypothetical protein
MIFISESLWIPTNTQSDAAEHLHALGLIKYMVAQVRLQMGSAVDGDCHLEEEQN